MAEAACHGLCGARVGWKGALWATNAVTVVVVMLMLKAMLECLGAAMCVICASGWCGVVGRSIREDGQTGVTQGEGGASGGGGSWRREYRRRGPKGYYYLR